MGNDDAVLAELDRQLGEQRSKVDSYAARSGLMIAAVAVLTSVVASSNETLSGSGPWLWVAVALSLVFGVLVFIVGRLMLGPSPVEVARWDKDHRNRLLQAKLLTVEANARALTRTEVVFMLEAASTIAAVGIIVIHIAKGVA